MSIEAAIREKLTAAFSPSSLAIENESHKHAHHREVVEGGAASQTGETHFRVAITSEAFAGKSRVERHRMVYEALDAELKAGVHALAVSAKISGEGG
ncbi:MAG: BolA family transcriptional regulator [Chitinophagales bacterium]|nr:BolA family transcriptional regulator [Hyphomicrobiales bacterium]